MELKPGNNRTEIGVIPEGWEVLPLGDAVDFLDGRRRPVKDADRAKMQGDIPYYGASGVVDYVHDFLFNEDLILLGEDGENILSRNCRLAFKVSGRIWVNNHAHVLRPRPGINLDFLVEYLESLNYAKYNTGTAQPKLNKLVCSQIPVVKPTAVEQRAIAEALSDVDGLLGGLDRLIAKKRDLKQAAMQQLLTGQTRLPGFTGEWEVKRLGDVADICSGGTPSTSQPQFWNGDLPWCTPTDITALGGYKYLRGTARTISAAGLRASSAEIIAPRSLIMTSRATIGECAINLVPMTTNQGFKNLIPFAQIDVEFLYYLMTTQKAGLVALCGGSTFLEIGKGQLLAYEIKLPQDRNEQSAIATVLSTMDAELAALEARRDKTRALKQAMMQELLTGRIRLVKLEPAAHA